MYEIKDVKEFINFVIPLFGEESGIVEGADAAVDFFMYGGCYDLAKSIKHYFPEAEYAVRNDNEHVAILYNDKLYDAMDYYEDWQLEKYNIPDEIVKKDIKDFKIYTEEEIENFPVEFGRIKRIKGVGVTDTIINLVDEIDSVKVNPKKTSIKY